MRRIPTPLLLGAAGCLTFALGTFGGMPAATVHTPSELEAAHGDAAVAIRMDLLKAAPAIPTAHSAYAQRLIKDFGPELTSANPDARLNAAILFAELKTISCDSVLITMLKSPDDSVRYWAAKGLETIAPQMKKVGPAAAIKALSDARAAEKSPVVSAQLDLALKAY